MKQKDIALIIVIVAISGVISFFVSHTVFKSGERQQKVEVVSPITTDFSAPSTKYFNSSAIDPTQTIQIGQDTNPAPFNTH
jgi:hypothetical protein